MRKNSLLVVSLFSGCQELRVRRLERLEVWLCFSRCRKRLEGALLWCPGAYRTTLESSEFSVKLHTAFLSHTSVNQPPNLLKQGTEGAQNKAQMKTALLLLSSELGLVLYDFTQVCWKVGGRDSLCAQLSNHGWSLRSACLLSLTPWDWTIILTVVGNFL